MTVIYGFINDNDTYVLRNIWKNIDNVKVLFINKNSQEEIDKAVKNETNILILCGHGSGEGLFGKLGYAVNKNSEIHAKNVIGVWCHAKDFAKKYHIKGFFTSMYISNRVEAAFELRENINNISDKEITKSETEFCNLLNSFLLEAIKNNTELNLKEWPKKVLKLMPPKNAVEKFNHENLEYID